MICISVVSPVFEAEGMVDELVRRLRSSLADITHSFEIILVDDGSTDRSWDMIVGHCQGDLRIKGIKLSRNFGQHHAITAGLDVCQGQWVVVMDCDLQDRPEEIRKLYDKAQEGYDVVFGKRSQRQDSFLKKITSNLYKVIFDHLKGSKTDFSIANFSISGRNVIDHFVRMREHSRSFGQFILWLGFHTATVDVEHARSARGRTSYTLRKLVKLGADVIVAYSNKPLRISIAFGLLMAAFSLLFGFYLILQYFIFHVSVAGWTSVMVSIYFLAGLLFVNLGIIGLYIGKIFEETKNRPLYVIEKKLNLQ